MKASFQWLRTLVNELPADPIHVAYRLTHAGLEVEGIYPFGEASDHVKVAKVLAVRPHPSRGALHLVSVDVGSSAAPVTVVCGASNIPGPGGLVVFAPIGTRLTKKGITLEARSIGGVGSEGMLCCEDDLGLSDDDGGIMVLPAGSAVPGIPLSKALPATRDTIFEIALTPNRPDGLGHIGLARELSALFNLRWMAPFAEEENPVGVTVSDERCVEIMIEDGDRCPHYAAAVVVRGTMGHSPSWLRYRLASLGVRALSNAVDVTNLVMLEYGHPLHAFDLDQVRGNRITVRRARNGEGLKTLDGIERSLSDDDLVIADEAGPIALAGVIGGESTEVRQTTQRILLECACFDPRSVRRMARRHNLRTEGGHRFERGIDWGDTRHVIRQALDQLVELTGGTAVGGVQMTVAKHLERPVVRIRTERLERLLGVKVPELELSERLTSLGFALQTTDAGCSWWRVPSHRPDVLREVDLIEEVVRVRGIDSIPSELPAIHPSREEAPTQKGSHRVRTIAVDLGLFEAVTYGFVSRDLLRAAAAPEGAVVIKNPFGDANVMRTSLLPGLLHIVRRARRHSENDVRFFSVGSVFLGEQTEPFPEERAMFAAVLAGRRPTYLEKPRQYDLWDGKGLVLGLLERVGDYSVTIESFTPQERPKWLHPRGAGRVLIATKEIGSFGLLHPDVVERFELDENTVVAELNLDALFSIESPLKTFRSLPRFPSSMRDLALVVSDAISAGEIECAVRDAAGPLAECVELFDRFSGNPIAADHVSLAFRVIYRALDRTLTDVEVDAQHAKVLEEVNTRFGAVLRT